MNHFDLRKASQKQGLALLTSLVIGISGVQTSHTVDQFKLFQNDRYETSFLYPTTWEENTGELSAGRVINAFVDPKDSDTSVSVVISPVPADYTKLTSVEVGKDTIRDYVLSKGEGVVSTIIDEKVKGDAYFLEYTVSAPDSPVRHIQSAFALRPQESVVGLTIQTKEESYGQNKELISKIMPSFKYTAN
eukprot:gene7763-15884_t